MFHGFWLRPLAAGLALFLAMTALVSAQNFFLRRNVGGLAPSNEAPVWVTASALGDYLAGQPFNASFSATDSQTVTLSVVGSLPAGLSLAGDIVSGTTPAAGPYGFTLRADDGVGGTSDRAFTFTSLAVPTGLASCAALLSAGVVTDGAYSINPTGSSAYQVWCDQTSDGGGWTLAAKATENISCQDLLHDGSAISGCRAAAVWDFHNAIWTNTTLLNTGSVNLGDSDAKFQSFTDLAFGEIRYGPLSSPTSGTILTKSAASLRALFAGSLNQSATVTRYGTGLWDKIGEASLSDSFQNINRQSDCGCGAGTARLGSGVCNGVCDGTTAAARGLGFDLNYRQNGSTVKSSTGNHTAVGDGTVGLWIR